MRTFGATSLEALAFQQWNNLDTKARFESAAVDRLFHSDKQVTETVGRLNLRRRMASDLSLEAGVEGAFNALDSKTTLMVNGFKVVVDIDLVGSFHVARRAFEHLRKPGASLIFITAPQSEVPMPYQAHVCAAKAGVDQFARVLAIEWGAAGVRVNAISPGPIEGTEGMKRLAPQGDEGDQLVRQMVPLGRMGTPGDIAQLAMFLGSDAASYISGTVIACDGGAQSQLTPMITAAAYAGITR